MVDAGSQSDNVGVALRDIAAGEPARSIGGTCA